MSLLNIIKEDLNKARKAKDRISVTVLTTLYAEAAIKGKNKGNRVSTDTEVTETILKFTKNAKEMLSHLTDADDRAKFEDEIETYEDYLPTQLTTQELSDAIAKIVTANNIIIPKGMGRVMKELSAQYAGRYDGKLASEIVRSYS